jgi:hypothetical protein
MSKRDRREPHNYNINAYYAKALSTKIDQQRRLKRPKKLPSMRDFQFFDTKRLQELTKKQMRFWGEIGCK